MFTSEYGEKNVTAFKGLYDRGLPDNCPPDHGTDVYNMAFTNKGECVTRDGFVTSLTLNHAVRRLFTSAIGSVLRPLTLDLSGNLYEGTNVTPILTIATMIDFMAINLYNKTYIAPILSTGTTTLRVWDGTTAVRNAAGLAPTAGSGISASTGGAGDVDAGVHQIAVVYVTNTGFKTPPGPKVAGVFTPNSYGAPGGASIDLASIPIGPTGTAQRQIIATKAGLLEYFIVPGGLINDNTSTTANINFLDSDLIIPAGYLFDLRETVTVGGYGTGLDKFDGRLIVFGGEGNLVRVSLPGDAESFDNVKGYIQIPDENDGNNVCGSFILRDSLYFTKFPGIFVVSVVDPIDPSTWRAILVDGGVGAIGYGISTISATQTHLTSHDLVVLADRQGLTIFDGVVRKPSLTWKIDNRWRTLMATYDPGKVTVLIDPFAENLYFHIYGVGFIYAANFSEGFTADAMKWSTWTWLDISLPVLTIAMATLVDSEFIYCLRLGFSTANFLGKVRPGPTSDNTAPIVSYYQTHLFEFGNGPNIFAAVRLRVRSKVGIGSTSLTVSALPMDLGSLTTLWIKIAQLSQEQFRQINYTSEKMALRFESFDVVGIILQRVDVYGKVHFQTRPG